MISKAAHTEENGTVIDDAMRAIEKENPRLKDILPKNFARGELDKRRLGDVIDLFSNIKMVEHTMTRTFLDAHTSIACPSLLRKKGKRLGNFSRHPALSVPLWKFCSLSMAGFTIRAVVLAACLSSPPNSLKIMSAISKKFPSMTRIQIRPHGKWPK